MQDQDKNFKIQKISEESIQMQTDIHLLEKEKDRLQFERDEFEKQLRHLEGAFDENKVLLSEK